MKRENFDKYIRLFMLYNEILSECVDKKIGSLKYCKCPSFIFRSIRWTNLRTKAKFRLRACDMLTVISWIEYRRLPLTSLF